MVTNPQSQTNTENAPTEIFVEEKFTEKRSLNVSVARSAHGMLKTYSNKTRKLNFDEMN